MINQHKAFCEKFDTLDRSNYKEHYDLHKVYCKIENSESHIFPENYEHWKWLDKYYEVELDEIDKDKVYVSVTVSFPGM